MEIKIIVILFLIIILAQSIETTTGFGATVIALSLGALVFPLKQLVPILVMIGIIQSGFIVLWRFRYIQWRILLARIMIFSGLGLPLGIWFYRHFPSERLKIFLGIFIILVSGYELYNLLIKKSISKPLSLISSILLLASGGFIHGVFATGGPLIVYYAGREIKNKAQFRATLSLLWLVLNFILLISYLLSATINQDNLKMTGLLLPALVLGIVLGEILHRKVQEQTFRVVVQIILFFTGVSILADSFPWISIWAKFLK